RRRRRLRPPHLVGQRATSGTARPARHPATNAGAVPVIHHPLAATLSDARHGQVLCFGRLPARHSASRATVSGIGLRSPRSYLASVFVWMPSSSAYTTCVSLPRNSRSSLPVTASTILWG